MTAMTYDFSLTPNVGSFRRIDAMGSSFKFAEANDDVKVEFRLDTGEVYVLRPGQGARMPSGRKFRQILVRNVSGTQVIGSLFVGGSDLIDDRITGTVNVVDAEVQKSRAGRIFSASEHTDNLPGQGPPQSYLMNPLNQDIPPNQGFGPVGVALKRVVIATTFDCRYAVVTREGVPAGVGGNMWGQSHSEAGYGGMQSAVQGWIRTAPFQAQDFNSFVRQGYMKAGVDMVIDWPEPLIIPAGRSVGIYAGYAAAPLSVTWTWEQWAL